jgi:hypothetical protein
VIESLQVKLHRLDALFKRKFGLYFDLPRLVALSSANVTQPPGEIPLFAMESARSSGLDIHVIVRMLHVDLSPVLSVGKIPLK